MPAGYGSIIGKYAVYDPPTDGSVPAGTVAVSDLCPNPGCSRVHLIRNLSAFNPAAIDAVNGYGYTCAAPGVATAGAMVAYSRRGTAPAGIISAINAGNTWAS